MFDINDLDETLPAPWEWDVKRLTASVVIAGRYLRLTETESARAAEATVRSYRQHMADYSSMRALEVWYDTIGVEDVAEALDDRARERDEAADREGGGKELAGVRVSEARRASRRRTAVQGRSATDLPSVGGDGARGNERHSANLSHAIARRCPIMSACCSTATTSAIIAIKVVGIGSVGTMCAIGLFIAADDDPLFLQVKEARASVLEPYAGKSVYENQGQRVVCGQRLMQSASDIFLGWTTGENGRDCLRAPAA